MRYTKCCWFAVAVAAAIVLVTRVDAQEFLGPAEDSDFGACCFPVDVENGEVEFELEDVFYLDDPDLGVGGAWEKFPGIPFGPDTDFPDMIPVGTVVKVHETVTLLPESPGFTKWHEHLQADSIVYEDYGESIGEEGALDGEFKAQWVEGSVMATVNGQNVLANVIYNNQDDDSTAWLYFNQMIGGNGQAVTLEIWKEYITTTEVSLYHPDDVNQEYPGGVAYIAMPEFPTNVPEPSACVLALVCGVLAIGSARRRIA